MKKLKKYCFFFLSVVISTLLLSPLEGISSNEEPKVGIALSGGGARTGAQIGALKVIHDLGIDISYISGTSTGSLIGALLAIGMPPKEIEKSLLDIDWEDVLRKGKSREFLFFRRKKDDLDFFIKYRLKFDGIKISLPKSLVDPHKLNLKIKRLLMPALDISDFDKLPIPFHAVTVDLESGEEFIISKGDLSKAVLASMAVPAILAPVKFENKWLIDGGIKNNIPVDVLKEMGADIIIVIDVTTPLKKVEDIKDFISTTDQMITMQTQGNAKNSLKKLAESDIYIRPDLENITTYDYSQFSASIERGEKAALAIKDKLRALSLKQNSSDQKHKTKKTLEISSPVIDSVTIQNDTRLSNKVIKKNIKISSGKTLNIKTLEKDVSRLYHLDAFESVDYKITEKNSKSNLTFITDKKPSGNDFIRFGLDIKTSTEGRSTFSFKTGYMMTQINRYNAEWRTVLTLGEKHELSTELYQPISYSLSYFIASKISISNRNTTIYFLGEALREERYNNAVFSLTLGRHLGRWGEISLGVLRGFGKLESRSQGTMQDSPFNGGGSCYFNFSIDTLDSVYFPKNGLFSKLDYTYSSRTLDSGFNSNTLGLSFLAAKSIAYNTFAFAFDGGLTFGAGTPLEDNFSLGGFLNLSGYSQNGIAGQHLMLFKFIYYLKVSGFSKSLITFPVYVGASFETGNTFLNSENIDVEALINAGSVFIGIDTILGPLFLGAGLSEGFNQALYLTVGNTF